jgi:pyruvate/2-oxoacid:ferredoxin oxidoreductase alpha subunit
MKKVLMGNHAVARAVALARVDVIAAYPITPQTLIVEELSELCANGECGAKFIKVESEHSALSCCMGASATGARTFTATAAHGLLLMHEILHWSAAARTPIVMVNVNRAIAPPWNLWTDQTDSLSQRDTGWIQLYCENNQEVLDTVLQAYKISEEISIPVMLVMDAFILSHTSEIVDVPDIEMVDRFLPTYDPPAKLDTNDPHAFGSITDAKEYQLLKQAHHRDISTVVDLAKRVDGQFEEIFGRSYGLVDPYRCEDAEFILVTSGTIAGTSRLAIDALRETGIAAGLLKVRLFRPFPREAISEAIGNAPKIAVLDRNISIGAGGIFAQEIKAALYDMEKRPTVLGLVGGMGGGDFTPRVIEDIVRRALRRTPSPDPTIWEIV